MSITLKINGFDEFERNLKKSGSQFKDVMHKALYISGKEVQDKAKRLAPVDTAHLKNSINVQVGELEAKVGPSVKYGLS